MKESACRLRIIITALSLSLIAFSLVSSLTMAQQQSSPVTDQAGGTAGVSKLAAAGQAGSGGTAAVGKVAAAGQAGSGGTAAVGKVAAAGQAGSGGAASMSTAAIVCASATVAWLEP